MIAPRACGRASTSDCLLSLNTDLELHAVSDDAVRDVNHLAHRVPAAAGCGDAAHRRRLVPAGDVNRRDRLEPDAPLALLGGRARARPHARDDAAGHADYHVHPVHHPHLGARCAFLIGPFPARGCIEMRLRRRCETLLA